MITHVCDHNGCILDYARAVDVFWCCNPLAIFAADDAAVLEYEFVGERYVVQPFGAAHMLTMGYIRATCLVDDRLELVRKIDTAHLAAVFRNSPRVPDKVLCYGSIYVYCWSFASSGCR